MKPENKEILTREPRVLNDEFYKALGIEYHSLKAKGKFPKEIREYLAGILGVHPSTYGKYLRIAREKGFITDSYEENMRVARHLTREWLLSEQGVIKGKKFNIVEFAKKQGGLRAILRRLKSLFFGQR